MVGYETSPPSPDPGFYSHVAVTSYFEQRMKCVLNEGQEGEPNCKAANGTVNAHYEYDYPNHTDGRGFTKTAETIRNRLTADGMNVDRVYTKVPDPQIIPEQYHDGTPIPDYLKLPTFAWDGTGNDLINHYVDGRSLILHRDHGWKDGWSSPTLSNGDIPSLTNGTELRWCSA